MDHANGLRHQFARNQQGLLRLVDSVGNIANYCDSRALVDAEPIWSFLRTPISERD